MLAVAAEVPQLSVVGVAGPGDALANAERTFAAFELVAKALPHLKLCLSTNGLALPDHVDRIVAMGVDHVTITINMVDPRDRRADLSVDLLPPQALGRRRRVAHPA